MTLHRPESLKDALDILVNAAGSGPAVVATGPRPQNCWM